MTPSAEFAGLFQLGDGVAYAEWPSTLITRSMGAGVNKEGASTVEVTGEVLQLLADSP